MKHLPKKLDWEKDINGILQVVWNFGHAYKDDGKSESMWKTTNRYSKGIFKLLTQQRTELLEKIDKLEYGGYIQVMSSKKNYDERNGYDKAIEDVTNLLNK